MQYTKFGRTGLSLSRLCFGTGTIGKQADDRTSQQILDTITEAGINFLDTANVYPMGGTEADVGRTEEVLGRLLKGKRENYFLASKAGFKMGPASWETGLSRKHLLSAIDASLKRLGTDYVDLYQCHIDDPLTPLDETLQALDIIVRHGKARYVGCSNYLAYRLARALGRSDVLGVARFISVQPRYNLLFREIEREILPLAAEESLAVIPYNPLAGGLLTGKYETHKASPESGRFSESELGKFGTMYQDRYWHEREFRTVEKLREIAKSLDMSLATMSIAWVLANPAITSAIIGASRPEQLSESLAAVDVKLDAELKKQLDDLTAEYRRGDAVR